MKFNSLEIQEIRNKFQLSQNDFGKMLGVGSKSVQNWEKGLSEISDSCNELLRMKLKYEIEMDTNNMLEENTSTYKINDREKIKIEDIIADRVTEKISPYFKKLETTMAEGLLDIDDIRELLEKQVKGIKK